MKQATEIMKKVLDNLRMFINAYAKILAYIFVLTIMAKIMSIPLKFLLRTLFSKGKK